MVAFCAVFGEEFFIIDLLVVFQVPAHVKHWVLGPLMSHKQLFVGTRFQRRKEVRSLRRSNLFGEASQRWKHFGGFVLCGKTKRLAFHFLNMNLSSDFICAQLKRKGIDLFFNLLQNVEGKAQKELSAQR